MSKLLITATKTVTPDKKTVNDSQVVFVESDKITILPLDSAARSLILANGFQFEVDAEVSELSAALAGENVSAYT